MSYACCSWEELLAETIGVASVLLLVAVGAGEPSFALYHQPEGEVCTMLRRSQAAEQLA